MTLDPALARNEPAHHQQEANSMNRNTADGTIVCAWDGEAIPVTATEATCPREAVFGGDDESRYPCTFTKGHEPPHSWEHPNLYPPSVADLARG